MAESHKAPECIKNQSRGNEPINVQFAQVFSRGNTLLIYTVSIRLKAPSDIFKDLVNNSQREVRMITVQIISEHSKQIDIAVFDFPSFCENVVQCLHNLSILPVQFTQKLENFVNRLFGKNIVDQVSDEQLHRRTLLFFDRSSLWRVTLIIISYLKFRSSFASPDNMRSRASWFVVHLDAVGFVSVS